MPLFIREFAAAQQTNSIISVYQCCPGNIAIHVFMVTIISNIGKHPLFFYKDRTTKRVFRFGGMFTRGDRCWCCFIAIG